MASYPFRIRISPDVIAQEVLLGETLLLDVKRLVYFGLDETGSEVWRVIGKYADGDEAYARLRDSSGLDEASLEHRFTQIIKGLERSRIISLEPVTT